MTPITPSASMNPSSLEGPPGQVKPIRSCGPSGPWNLGHTYHLRGGGHLRLLAPYPSCVPEGPSGPELPGLSLPPGITLRPLNTMDTPLRIGKETPYCRYHGRRFEAWKKLEAGNDRNVRALIRRGKIVKDAMAKENS